MSFYSCIETSYSSSSSYMCKDIQDWDEQDCLQFAEETHQSLSIPISECVSVHNFHRITGRRLLNYDVTDFEKLVKKKFAPLFYQAFRKQVEIKEGKGYGQSQDFGQAADFHSANISSFLSRNVPDYTSILTTQGNWSFDEPNSSIFSENSYSGCGDSSFSYDARDESENYEINNSPKFQNDNFLDDPLSGDQEERSLVHELLPSLHSFQQHDKFRDFGEIDSFQNLGSNEETNDGFQISFPQSGSSNNECQGSLSIAQTSFDQAILFPENNSAGLPFCHTKNSKHLKPLNLFFPKDQQEFLDCSQSNPTPVYASSSFGDQGIRYSPASPICSSSVKLTSRKTEIKQGSLLSGGIVSVQPCKGGSPNGQTNSGSTLLDQPRGIQCSSGGNLDNPLHMKGFNTFFDRMTLNNRQENDPSSWGACGTNYAAEPSVRKKESKTPSKTSKKIKKIKKGDTDELDKTVWAALLEKIPNAKRRDRMSNPSIRIFLKRLIQHPCTKDNLIRWEDRSKGEFKILKPDLVARIWGSRSKKHEKDPLSYENFATAIRRYYEKKKMHPAPGKHVFRFGADIMQEINQIL